MLPTLGKYFSEIAESNAKCVWQSVFRTYWFKLFKDDRMLLDDAPHLGRLLTSTQDAHMIKLLKSCVSIDVLTIRRVAENYNILVCLCHKILV